MVLRRIQRVDVVVAAVFLSGGLAEELGAPVQLPYWWARLGLATLLVLGRRVAPLATMVVDLVVLQALLMPMNVDNYRVWQAFCLLIGMHTIGREVILRGPDRDPLWRRVGAIVVVAGTVGYLSVQDLALRSDYFATIGYLLAAWVSGLLLQLQARRIAERNAAVAAAEALRARESLADERARIARELHDIVAHSVTVMVLQTGAVRRRLHPGQEGERDLLAGVEEAGREAVAELRRTLGLLRGAEGPALAPTPGLARLDDLVEQVREAGLALRVEVRGEPRPLPSSVDVSAYRIVQQALTNVLKHSGARSAGVTVAYEGDGLRLTVTDPGGRPIARRPEPDRGGPDRGGPDRPEPDRGGPDRSGHGLVGMRERVAMFGGTLTAGPGADGGYRLEAHLPVPARREYAGAEAAR